MKLVSILIPNYNSEKYLEETIQSAIKQTYSFIEIIVVDNKSTDKSWDILKNLSKLDSRLKIYQNKENLGPIRNWKKCLEYADGQYGVFLWSDDYFENTFIEQTIKYIDNDDVGFVITQAKRFEEKEHLGKILFDLGETGCRKSSEYISSQLLRGDYPVSPACAIFRLSDLKKNLVLNIANKVDSDFSMHAIGNDVLIYLLTAQNYPYFYYISSPLVNFRAHKNSITCSTNIVKIKLFYLIAKAYFIDKHITDKCLIKKFNSILLFNIIKYRGSNLNLTSVKDFYIYNKYCRISIVFFVKKILLSLINKIKIA